MKGEITLRHKRAKIAKKIKENLAIQDRHNLLDMQLALLKKSYANLLEKEDEFEKQYSN